MSKLQSLLHWPWALAFNRAFPGHCDKFKSRSLSYPSRPDTSHPTPVAPSGCNGSLQPPTIPSGVSFSERRSSSNPGSHNHESPGLPSEVRCSSNRASAHMLQDVAKKEKNPSGQRRSKFGRHRILSGKSQSSPVEVLGSRQNYVLAKYS